MRTIGCDILEALRRGSAARKLLRLEACWTVDVAQKDKHGDGLELEQMSEKSKRKRTYVGEILEVLAVESHSMSRPEHCHHSREGV